VTTAFLQSDLEFFEGEPGTSKPALVGLPDPISGGEPYTAGWGHTGPDVALGATYTLTQCEAWLSEDISHSERELDAHLPWWRKLSDVRQDVYCQLCFNMGIGGLLEFHHMNAAAQVGDWLTASAELLASEMAAQVGNRAKILAKELLDNVHISPEIVL
jgi:GH24 family phage-related lysozyme (muramidase)